MSTNEMILTGSAMERIDNEIVLLQQYEATAKEFEEKAEKIRDEIKAVMTQLDVDVLKTPVFIVRWTEYIQKRFDSKRFLKEMGDEIYNEFTKQVIGKKFVISK